MVFRFILFFGLFLSVLFGAHFALYFSVIHFFGITDSGTKTMLLWAVFLLSFSFFLSALLIRVHGNILFNFYYQISAFWVGLLVQLLFATALVWALVGVSRVAHFQLPLAQVTSVLFGLAVAVAFYGVWNAFHPVIKNVEVGLKNLPKNWIGKTVVQLSDVHLGAIHGAGFLRRVVSQVNTLHPDLVLITGDLFDGMDGDLTGFIEPLDSIQSKKGVYFVTGNHEGYLGLENALPILSKTKVQYLKDAVKDIDGLQLVGVDYPLAGLGDDPKAVFESKGYDPKKPTILMYHTPTNVLHTNGNRSVQQTSAYLKPDLDFSYAKSKGVDLQLSGHTHQGQFPPFSWVAHWIYDGHDSGLFSEDGFNLYVSPGVGTWGPPLRLFNQSEIVAIKLKGI